MPMKIPLLAGLAKRLFTAQDAITRDCHCGERLYYNLMFVW
jgi:hypothetical protein